MSVRIEEQIRRFTQMVDEMAPPLTELAPDSEPDGTLPSAPQVEVTIPLRRPASDRMPAWVYAIGGAAAVLALLLPIWLLMSNTTDVADSPSPPIGPSPEGFVYLDIADATRTNGSGWPAGVPVRASVDGAEPVSVGETGDDGSFDFGFPLDIATNSEITVEVGEVRLMSVVPEMTVTEFDASGNRVLGKTDLTPDQARCCLSIFMFTSSGDSEGEEFRVEIARDGTWVADLDGRFDVTNSSRADLVFGDPEGLWLAWLDLRPDVAGSNGPVLDPLSGHYYEAVFVPGGISWAAAASAAEGRTFQGLQGHLVTITSDEENQFLIGNLPQAFATGPNVLPYWLGGVQDPGSAEPAGGWRWVTGEPWVFENWGDGEPNNSVEGEECLHAHHSVNDETRWNDHPCNASIDGYIVEFSPAG